MKTKIVLWGTNENDEKVLLGIELIDKENKVNIYAFPESSATEDFYNLMLNDWRINNPVVFPENHTIIERPLSITESLLPDNLKVTRMDVVNRAKTEWHFIVLSAKLYQSYKIEIEEFKERIAASGVFDKNIWEELKLFWKKVQEQVYEKSLFREHAKELHDETNVLFDKLKEFRKKLDQEFQKGSKERAEVFQKRLSDVQKKISDGFGLQPLWNEMKKMQTDFRSENLSKHDRNDLWNKIDAVFKAIKEKKYGSKQGGGNKNNALERIENRYKGLLAAVKKMENSIKWDKKDLNFQGGRVQDTFGQLEQEIRKAKIKMIEERINSKEVKLNEMLTTKTMLEEKIAKEHEKIARIAEAQKIKEAELAAKARIKSEIEAKNKSVEETIGSETIAAAVAATGSSKPVEETKPVSETPKEDPASKEEANKVESPVSDEVEAVVAEAKEVEKPVEETKSIPETPEEEVASEEEVNKEESSISDEVDAVVTAVTGAAEDIVDTVKATAKVIGEKISKKLESFKSEEE